MRLRNLFFLFVIGIAGLCTLPSCKNYYNDSDNPENKVTVYGTVSDIDSGEPMSNVNVSAVEAAGTGGVIAKTTTGYDGNYEMTMSATSLAVIRAEKAKYLTAEEQLSMEATTESERRVKVDIQMHKAVVLYRGTVTSEATSGGISNVKIDVAKGISIYQQPLASTFTDAYGEYEIEVPLIANGEEPEATWTNTVTATKDGYKTQSQTVNHTISDLGKTYTIDFKLSSK